MTKEPTIDELLKVAHQFPQIVDERAKREIIKSFHWLEQQNKFLYDIITNVKLRNELGLMVVRNAISQGVCPKCGAKLEEREIEGKKRLAFCVACGRNWLEG